MDSEPKTHPPAQEPTNIFSCVQCKLDFDYQDNRGFLLRNEFYLCFLCLECVVYEIIDKVSDTPGSEIGRFEEEENLKSNMVHEQPTLHDQFAMAALAGIVARNGALNYTRDECIEEAYTYADVAMKVR